MVACGTELTPRPFVAQVLLDEVANSIDVARLANSTTSNDIVEERCDCGVAQHLDAVSPPTLAMCKVVVCCEPHTMW